MAKKILQDLILDKKKRDAVGRVSQKKFVPKITEQKTNEAAGKEEKKIHIAAEKKQKSEEHAAREEHDGKREEIARNRKIVWASVAGTAAAAAAIFILGTVFAEASIEVSPKKSAVPLNAQFTAQKNGGGIPFEIMITKGSETRSVKATGTKHLERKASGKIVIYNTYNQAPQKLVRNTRFEAPGGKIYRIAADITVPGMRVSGGESTPGSIETTVYASEPGAAYNVGLTDFTIPGFKGDPRYAKFYARSKTEITGGFSGTAPVASEKDVGETKKALEASLKDDLLHDAASQVPEGYVFYNDSIKIDFDDVKDISDDSKSVVLMENGALTGVLLKKDPLLSEITRQITSATKDPLPFTVDSPESLKFSFQNGTLALGTETKEVNFSLSGNVNITYSVDTGAIVKDLLNKQKTDFQKTLSGYPSVYKAKIASFRPFWAKNFPGKESAISVSVTKNQI